MILVIDNYDSFIYNIVQYLGEYEKEIQVYRNDAISLDEALNMKIDGIVISPGPGRPEESGVSLDMIRYAIDENIPLLGVCLGHQALTIVVGGQVSGATHIMHGKASSITHNGKGVFEGIPSPFTAIRYHSLVAVRASLPETLEITAESDDGEIMGLAYKDKPIYGVQFHPESILTDYGKQMIANFVRIVHQKQQEKLVGKVSSLSKNIFQRLSMRENLSEEETEAFTDLMLEGHTTPSQIAAYLSLLRMKGETAAEIAGSARSMARHCVSVNLSDEKVVDTCGSGGDKSNTFNISTAAAFVVAGAGYKVAKHGNRSITSQSGSADVLEKLGFCVTAGPDVVKRCIEKTNFGFIFAPQYHPGLKYVMPVRKELGFRTLFNILGPLVNPAHVKYHVMGVFSRELYELLPEVFVRLGYKRALVLHGEGGLDEATIEGKTLITEIKESTTKEMILDPADFNLAGKLENCRISSPEESKTIIENILQRKETGDPSKAVILNAGLAIYILDDISLDQAFTKARQAIENGRAWQTLLQARELSWEKA
ncbi:anthranilate phosphoribosyltransferase [Thermospira aquatica]|uniref:Anthranilate phosphoribosyltransferase n=1 Tax=Thermospira aquatica TaxID=2828656 RepID=A0AAX3BEC6_9SPIR|nr:anthranilate phosphoribosyltransferase [Thermospira aquatica]URA10111.1 anthranilate phosphoribosyltransferase [Thermospira aquatica]